jgi:histidine kinase
MMFGRPSLRRRLIVSYVALVAAVTLAGFVTVQVLVPQFFEQGVQQRLGPGAPGGNQPQGNPGGPGQGEGNPTSTTDVVTTNPSSTTTPPDEPGTDSPGPTGSTRGPGEPPEDPGNQGSGGGGSGAPGGNNDPGSETGRGDDGNGNRSGATRGPGTTTDAAGWLGPGVQAAAQSGETERRSPVPAEIQEEYDRALTGALIAATIIGLVLAIGLGYLLTRRLLRTFEEVTSGARRLADGHYDTRVAEPREAELADLARSVNTLADSLQRTAETRARLVSDLAHEIRNPLSTIEGYMEGLIDGVLPASRATYEAVATEAHRLKGLTRDLSTLSKAQEGAIEYSMVAADLASVCAGVAETLNPQFEINDVELTVQLGETLPIHGDPDRLAQALTNLLGNALAHTPQGGSVTVRDVSDANDCSIAIADTGPGIPESDLETIFERFTRLDREQPGTGIGLNIARTLVRDHGGDVVAVSPGQGQGATFTVTLPRS